MSKPRSWTSSLPFIFLFTCVTIFFRRVLFDPLYIFPWDFRAVHLPFAQFIADSFRRGELPLWEPYTYCGVPMFANIQAMLFYPPSLLAIIASNLFDKNALPVFLEWAVALQVYMAGCCTYLLLKQLGTGAAAGCVGAVIAGIGSFFASQPEHMGAMQAACWIPLAWLSVVYLSKGAQARWIAALATALGMSILAGLPEVSVVVFASSAGLALCLVCFRLAKVRLLRDLALGWGWGLALAAIQLIPTYQLSRLSVAKYRAEWLTVGRGLRPQSLISLVWPNYFHIFDLKKFSGPGDPVFLYLYVSILGLALALAAILFKRDRLSWAFAAMTLGATVFMLGDFTPAGRAIYRFLPKIVQIGLHPEFFYAAFGFALAILAGLGAQRFLKSERLRWGVAALIAADLIATGSNRPMNIASTLADPEVTTEAFDGSRELLKGVRELVDRSTPPFRIDTVDASLGWSQRAGLTRVPTASGADPLALERLMRVRSAFSQCPRWGWYCPVADARSPVLDLLNVKYILARTPLNPAKQGSYKHLEDLPGNMVYETAAMLPRFFLVGRIIDASGLDDAVAKLSSKSFDPGMEAIVEGPVSLSNKLKAGDGTVRVIDYRSKTVTLDVNSPAPAFLVTSEANYPGWNANIDDRPAAILYTNVAFRGLPIPAGRHIVRFSFVPWILFFSAIPTLLAALAICYFVVAQRLSEHPKATGLHGEHDAG